jgi:hypothetical protein
MKDSVANITTEVDIIISKMICSIIPWELVVQFCDRVADNAITSEHFHKEMLLTDVAKCRMSEDIIWFAEKCDNVNECANNGSTPLMFACQRGLLDTARYLIDNRNADVIRKNRAGQTALDYARQTQNSELVKYIDDCMTYYKGDNDELLLKQQQEFSVKQDKLQAQMDKLTMLLNEVGIDEDITQLKHKKRREQQTSHNPQIDPKGKFWTLPQSGVIGVALDIE